MLGHKSFQISMKKSNNFGNILQNNNFTPKSKLFNDKIVVNSSNNKNNTPFNDNFGTYSFRNTSINLDKININNNSKNNIIINKVYKNYNSNININKNNIDLKSQIKQNLMNKLREDEKERKRIQEEIRQIEKEQYYLWMNFNENMNSNNKPDSNIAKKKNILKKNLINDINYKNEDDDNLVNYNYNFNCI